MGQLSRLAEQFSTTTLPLEEILLRLTAAAVLALMVGWQREANARPAGVKTHMLVGVGSATFIIVALELIGKMGGRAAELQVDPTRIIEGVIGGIGFLGAGSIIQSRGSVHGLTTAAGIWAVGGVGLACGIGQFALAIIVTILIVFILAVFGWLERYYSKEG